jgi:hypothetical protein
LSSTAGGLWDKWTGSLVCDEALESAGVTAGKVGGGCAWGGGIGSGGFGGLSADASGDAGFAGVSTGDSTGAAVWVLLRTAKGATTAGFSATAAGEAFSVIGGDVSVLATGFGCEVGAESK